MLPEPRNLASFRAERTSIYLTAQVQMKLGMAKEALNSIDEALTLAPTDRSYSDLDPRVKFEDDFIEAASNVPHKSDLYAMKASCLIEKKEFAKASESLLKAERLEPRALVYRSFGQLYLAQGDFKKALLHLDKSIESDGSDAESFAYRSTAYKSLGDQERAAKDEQKAESLRKRKGNFYLR